MYIISLLKKEMKKSRLLKNNYFRIISILWLIYIRNEKITVYEYLK